MMFCMLFCLCHVHIYVLTTTAAARTATVCLSVHVKFQIFKVLNYKVRFWYAARLRYIIGVSLSRSPSSQVCS